MAGDKSEQPTPKRMNEARKKGQVFKSRDFIQSLLFITAAAVVAAGGPTYFTELSDLMKQFFQPDGLCMVEVLSALRAAFGSAGRRGGSGELRASEGPVCSGDHKTQV